MHDAFAQPCYAAYVWTSKLCSCKMFTEQICFKVRSACKWNIMCETQCPLKLAIKHGSREVALVKHGGHAYDQQAPTITYLGQLSLIRTTVCYMWAPTQCQHICEPVPAFSDNGPISTLQLTRFDAASRHHAPSLSNNFVHLPGSTKCRFSSAVTWRNLLCSRSSPGLCCACNTRWRTPWQKPCRWLTA